MADLRSICRVPSCSQYEVASHRGDTRRGHTLTVAGWEGMVESAPGWAGGHLRILSGGRSQCLVEGAPQPRSQRSVRFAQDTEEEEWSRGWRAMWGKGRESV